MNMITAMDINNGIGVDNGLPWRLKEDLQYFKDMTVGKTILMGLNTLNSLKDQKPLPNRRNIVLSKEKVDIDGVDVINSIDELFEITTKEERRGMFVIGGASVYEQMIDMCEEVYITMILDEYNVDTYFPKIQDNDSFELTYESEEMLSKNNILYKFTKYRKI